MTLFEIDEAIRAAIESGVDPDTGELMETAALELDHLAMEREKKIEGVCLYLKELKVEEAALKEEAKKLSERAAMAAKKAEGLKMYIRYATGEEKFKTSRVQVSYRNVSKVGTVDESLLPEEFWRIKSEVNKVAIAEQFRAGKSVPGCTWITERSLTVK